MFALLILSSLLGANAVQFTIQNNAGAPVWVGILGNPGKPHLENGGFVLDPNEQKLVTSPTYWAGRFWGRSWCNDQSKHCETGDCGNKVLCGGSGVAPPYTMIEITLRSGNTDHYDITLHEGFNLKASIRPTGGIGNCSAISCPVDLNVNCPNELRLLGLSRTTIGCKSSCDAFKTDQCCCTGDYDMLETCHPEQNCRPVNSAKYFKDNCPDALSYVYDNSGIVTCLADEYYITFG